MTEPDPRFEHRVTAALRAEADRYLVLAAAAGLYAAPLRLHVSVTTWQPLRARTRGQLFRLLVSRVDRNLPAARLGNVHFGEDPALPAPGHHFGFQPPAGPAPPQRGGTRPYPMDEPTPYPMDEPVPYPRVDRTRLDQPPYPPLLNRTRLEQPQYPPPPPPPPPEPAPGKVPETPEAPVERAGLAELTLRYGTVLDWRCHLGAAAGWVPLGRWPVHADRHAGFRLPAYATFVPRGQLVVLRLGAGRILEFARTSARPGYVVCLDGIPLRGDGVPAAARPAGQLAYGDGSAASTVIDYDIAWERTVG